VRRNLPVVVFCGLTVLAAAVVWGLLAWRGMAPEVKYQLLLDREERAYAEFRRHQAAGLADAPAARLALVDSADVLQQVILLLEKNPGMKDRDGRLRSARDRLEIVVNISLMGRGLDPALGRPVP
jgi:hypothetical protein